MIDSTYHDVTIDELELP